MVDLVEVDRSTAKMLTLAKMYRLTAEGYSKKMGIAVEDARNILGKLDAEMPWMSEVSDLAMRTASVRGFVRTLLGARRRFDKWTSRKYWQIYEDTGSFPEPMSKQAAQALYGSNNIIRFGARKALNSVVQGSGGDITKQALLDVWQQTKIIPYMTVHDEIDMPCEDEATASKVKKIMEDALKDRLSVPMKVDAELIDHWV
jgi:DNA polymerase I-like protein with 3'-5' exonuclease and polymerase domains